MIIVKFQYGLGNQLFQYAIGLALSKKRHTCVFFDLSFFEKNTRDFKLHYFSIKFKTISGYFVKILSSRFLNFFLGKIDERLLFKTVYDPVWDDLDFSSLKLNGNLILYGFWSFNIYFDEYRDLISQSISLKKKYHNSDYLKMKDFIESVDSVAIHIRRGDYVSVKSNNDFFGVLSSQYYRSSIEVVNSKLKDPKFFIFTDDVAWVKDNFNYNKDYIIVSETDSLNDYHEFDLMKTCKHQIIANSTFSWWAAYLNNYSNKIIVQPAVWYKSMKAQNVYENSDFLKIENSVRI